MIREDLESRETEVIRIISLLRKADLDFVLIGGYAVTALGSHRFSMDCDVVIQGKDAGSFATILKAEGYGKQQSAKGFDEFYGGGTETYAKKIGKGAVSVDLLIDSVVSRQTKAAWSYKHILDNSREEIVSGTRNSVTVLVPNRELLIAMKIHSGRDADMRDIIILGEEADWKLVAKHLTRGSKDELLKRIARALAVINAEEFISSLKATFSIRGNVEPMISASKRGLLGLRRIIESSPE